MRSMTGYGRAAAPLGTDTLTVVVSSVNRKTLDLGVKLPTEWEDLESAVTELVRQHATRGRIEVTFEVSGSTDAGAGPDWDDGAVGAALDRLQALARSRGVAFQADARLLWEIASAQRNEQQLPSSDDARETVLAALGEALRAFSAMRAREGEALLVDFIARIMTLRRHVDGIANRAPLVPAAYRELLMKRLREAGLELRLDDERVLREVAIFADRCDISEELTRFRSHLEQFEALLRGDGEIGRKAEFILQEMGRETNTMGSKANDLGIARHVIEMKNELERIREQVANVE